KTIDVLSPKCVAGHYEGAFEMRYRSGPAGVCGLFAQLDEAVAQGHWSFSLTSSATADSYTVNAGCLTAGDSGQTVPVYASITGSVECSSGKFFGELRGTYNSTSVCTLGVGREDSFFKGTMSGTYDPVTRSFLDTHVEWHEPPVAIPPQPGGEGSWTAVLTPDAGLSDGPVDCLHGVVFPEDKFPKSP
ncbi:MAG: hypothetical protein JWN48_84, partial [Myxococcaceae bacterium]|nr:hypothetical protein [Myxococcaceae bacterium]